MTRPLSPECRLVFRTADPACASSEFATLASQVTDWERVLILAQREMATARLARAVVDAGNGVPSEVSTLLRRQALTDELRMQYLSRRLQQTCRMLGERGVRCMLLKGAAVGAMVDPTFCWRPMRDADVLVRGEDVDRAAESIIETGWVPTSDEVLRGLLANAHHRPPFLDPQMPGIRLELHVSLLPASHPFVFDESIMWREARPDTESFAGALIPSPEHLLLHAAIHFAWQHSVQFGAWRTFRVVAAANGIPGFDWDRFVTAAQHARATSASYWTLRLAQTMAGIPAPPDVLRRLTPSKPEWILGALERHFIAAIAVGETPRSPSEGLTRRLWVAAMKSSHGGSEHHGNWDIENRWGRAYGNASTETIAQRFQRHTAGYRQWLSFVTETLVG